MISAAFPFQLENAWKAADTTGAFIRTETGIYEHNKQMLHNNYKAKLRMKRRSKKNMRKIVKN